jgi:hypothetical protein
MPYIIDGLYIVRELLKLSFVIITSPFAFIAAGLLFVGNSSI